MKGYWIARVTVTDPDTYKFYAEAAPAAFAKYNAKTLARAGRCEHLEGGGRPRNVVIEFPSYDDAIACYHSDDYQAARQHRLGAGDVEIVIVEGI
jgi:uncharacterized protein (DUF1330 family)